MATYSASVESELFSPAEVLRRQVEDKYTEGEDPPGAGPGGWPDGKAGMADVVRCPLCRWPLVAVYRRPARVGFQCGC